MSRLVSEDDIQKAVARLRKVLPDSFCRQFFGSERLTRLEKIVGVKTISSHFLLDLIVRHQGPQLLAERPRRIGAETTSIRKALLKSLSDDEIGRLFEQLRRKAAPAGRQVIEKDLAEYNWHRGSASAVRVTRALGLPDSFPLGKPPALPGRLPEFDSSGSSCARSPS